METAWQSVDEWLGAMHSLALAKPTSSDGDNGKTHGSTKVVLMKNTNVYFAQYPFATKTCCGACPAEGWYGHVCKAWQRAHLWTWQAIYTSFALDAPNSEEKRSPEKQP